MRSCLHHSATSSLEVPSTLEGVPFVSMGPLLEFRGLISKVSCHILFFVGHSLWHMAWRHHAACLDSASRLCSSSWSVVLFHPLSSRIWSACLRSLPTTCMSILLPSKSVIHGTHLITNLYRQYTMRNCCCSLHLGALHGF